MNNAALYDFELTSGQWSRIVEPGAQGPWLVPHKCQIVITNACPLGDDATSSIGVVLRNLANPAESQIRWVLCPASTLATTAVLFILETGYEVTFEVQGSKVCPVDQRNNMQHPTLRFSLPGRVFVADEAIDQEIEMKGSQECRHTRFEQEGPAAASHPWEGHLSPLFLAVRVSGEQLTTGTLLWNMTVVFIVYPPDSEVLLEDTKHDNVLELWNSGAPHSYLFKDAEYNPHSLPDVSNPTPTPSPEVQEESAIAAGPKRRRQCGLCKQEGHNKATCPQRAMEIKPSDYDTQFAKQQS
ncbi:hypothetical protein BDZ89DRAFT_1145826 [Hymenopellis radicata]|nr:hypothetical protein BDZ89DRAFT_1145826 [Hymenopellis radicata]